MTPRGGTTRDEKVKGNVEGWLWLFDNFCLRESPARMNSRPLPSDVLCFPCDGPRTGARIVSSSDPRSRRAFSASAISRHRSIIVAKYASRELDPRIPRIQRGTLNARATVKQRKNFAFISSLSAFESSPGIAKSGTNPRACRWMCAEKTNRYRVASERGLTQLCLHLLRISRYTNTRHSRILLPDASIFLFSM